MKSTLFEVVGCIGSQSFRKIADFDTMREAKAESRKRNQLRADAKGVSLRAHLSDLNPEGHFVTAKAEGAK